MLEKKMPLEMKSSQNMKKMKPTQKHSQNIVELSLSTN